MRRALTSTELQTASILPGAPTMSPQVEAPSNYQELRFVTCISTSCLFILKASTWIRDQNQSLRNHGAQNARVQKRNLCLAQKATIAAHQQFKKTKGFWASLIRSSTSRLVLQGVTLTREPISAWTTQEELGHLNLAQNPICQERKKMCKTKFTVPPIKSIEMSTFQ